MKISKVSIDRPVTTIMFVLIVVFLGIISLTKLPINLYPDMEIPYAVVVTHYSGAGPSEIETLVTKPMEEVLGTVSNIKEVTSISSNEKSVVILEFVDGTDMDFATLDVREKVDLIKNMLPGGTDDPMIIKMDLNAQPIMQIGISGEYDLVQLNDIIEDKLKNKLERISGVASVEISGAKEEEIKIILSPEKLSGYNLDVNTISNVLRAENINLPIGDVREGSKKIIIRSVGEFSKIEEIRNLPITSQNGIIYLRDVAEVEESFKEMTSFSYINNEPCIVLSIKKQSTANTVEVSKQLHRVLEQLGKENPDLNFKTIEDQAETINTSINSVKSSAVKGGVLALIILFVFLRSVSSTLIVGVAIPVSVIASFAIMYFTNIKINIISLGGLTLGMGMLVDNSIVVLENIYRHRHNGDSKKEAANKGVSEVGMAVIASTFTTIAVFLPMVFTEGITSKIFKDLSLTVTYSLIASLIVALTIVPMMASKILKIEKVDETKRKRLLTRILDGWGRILDKVDNNYKKLLNKTIHHRKMTALVSFLVFIGSLAVVPFVGMNFMPPAEEGQFDIQVELPIGTRIESTLNKVHEIEGDLSKYDEIIDIFTIIGGGKSSTATVKIDVGNDEVREREVAEIMDEVRNDLNKVISGAKLSYTASQVSMRPTSKPITIEITGEELDTLAIVANDIKKMAETVDGTREVDTSIDETLPEVQISIDRDKASKYGITSSMAAMALQKAVKGSVVTKYKVDGSEIDVRILYEKAQVEYIKDIENLSILSPMGIKVPIGSIASISQSKSPATINHKANKKIVTVEMDLMGIDTNSAKVLIEEKLKDYEMPKGYTYEFAGDVKEMMESFKSLALALVMAIVLVYMILAAQFESFLHPFIIMFSVPMALSGGLFALFITGNELSMPAIIGFIMLVGIVVNNAIVLVDYINQLIHKGYTRSEAILEAGPTRLRPILMTTMTTVLAMLPMALGLGEGSEMMAPMAVTVIGGLLLSTLLTLIVIPLNYSIFDDIKKKFTSGKK